tara:strand:- start:170 stop:838 length:669 start_codon:yes stop_codon:yes gene_type:complete
MGYLNNTTVTVDAILTKRGRELLSMGTEYFNITQFALSDDECDYRLWNPAHALGSNYYGELIENMPVMEALPDETTQMLFKLVSLPKTSTKIPVIDVGATALTFTSNGQLQTVVPQTTNMTNGNATYGYTAILSDASVCDLTVSKALPAGIQIATTPTFIGDAGQQSKTVTGMEFALRAKQNPTQDLTATLIIVANETGGRQTISVQVNQPIATVPYGGGGA